MNDCYLVDTSVWIDYFRGNNNELSDVIDQLIDEDRIFINGIIKCELLVGTKTRKEYNSINGTLDCINWLELDGSVFAEISKVGFKLKREGISVPLSDLIIAVQANLNNHILIENNKHYKIINQILPLRLYSSRK